MSVIVHTALICDPLPKPRPRAQVRQKRDGSAFAHIYTPSNGWREMEKAIGMQLLAAGVRRPELGDVEVALKFFTATATRGDIDNLAKLVLDAMNGVVWKDDKQITALYCEVHERDRHPRTEIFVRHAAGTQTYLSEVV